MIKPEERLDLSGFTNEWIKQGIALGTRKLILRQLRRRFGEISDALRQRVEQLPEQALDGFAEALLDFHSLADAEIWLAQHANQP